MQQSEANESLDRPLLLTPQATLTVVAALLLAIALRLFDLSARPMHNDEGVNFFFLQQIEKLGYYPYSHSNYHGPFYFYLTRLFFSIFGSNDLSLRSSAIFIGALTVLSPLMLRGIWRSQTIAFLALLLASSSSLSFYSRYAIHETLFNLAGILTALGLLRWHLRGEISSLLCAAVGVAVLITTKETFIITLAAVGAAALLLFNYRLWWKRIFEHAGVLMIAAVTAMIVVAATFSGGFQWADGLREMSLAVPQWIGRTDSQHGDTGHFKPPVYYFKVFAHNEPTVYLLPALILLVVGTVVWKRYGRSGSKIGGGYEQWAVPAYFTVWCAISVTIYSVVRYKTPWLIINLTTPALFAIAAWVDTWLLVGASAAAKGSPSKEVSEHSRAPIAHYLSPLVLGVSVLVGLGYSVVYNFVIPYGKENLFSYVHTSAGTLELTSDILSYVERHPRAMVLIGVHSYWPLPYYLRGIESQVHYLSPESAGSFGDKYEILLLEPGTRLPDTGWAKKYYRLSEVQETETYFKRDS